MSVSHLGIFLYEMKYACEKTSDNIHGLWADIQVSESLAYAVLSSSLHHDIR